GRAYNTCHIRSHGVHQEIVGRIGLLAFDLRYPGCHRHSRNPCRSDQRVDLSAREPAHDLAYYQTTHSTEHERQQTQTYYHESFESQEVLTNCSGTDRHAEKYRYDIYQCILSRI